MARIRSLKPEFWSDEELAIAVSRDARMLYMGLWNLADEHARLRGDPRYVKGQVFAYDDDLTPAAINGLLDELSALGKVVRYRVAGAQYLVLPKLAAHQRLEPDKTPSRLPSLDDADPEPEPPPQRRSEIFPEQSAQKRTVDDARSVAAAETAAEQPEPEIADLSAQIPEESALARARLFSKGHVASNGEQGSGESGASLALRPAQLRLVEEPIEGELVAVEQLPENAGQLNRQWIDHCRSRNLKLTTTHIKRYGAGIKKALDDGFPVDLVKRALAEMLDDRVVSKPNLLGNYLVRVQQGPELPPRRATPGEASVIRMSPPGEDVGALIHDALTRPA